MPHPAGAGHVLGLSAVPLPDALLSPAAMQVLRQERAALAAEIPRLLSELRALQGQATPESGQFLSR
jgi:hypothetical protein